MAYEHIWNELPRPFPFKATHKVVYRPFRRGALYKDAPVQEWEIMLVEPEPGKGGPAYTREEWEHGVIAGASYTVHLLRPWMGFVWTWGPGGELSPGFGEVEVIPIA